MNKKLNTFKSALASAEHYRALEAVIGVIAQNCRMEWKNCDMNDVNQVMPI